tara:strand:+ start:166 stop:1119 length:954 start_codon:yes stop_codon:yes gene_type:complete
MIKDKKLPKYIIILGTFRSGSGAILDYLNGRGDLYDPMGKEEYHLPHMPNGLMTLEAITEEAFHPASADFALSQFENITSKLSHPGSFWRYGRGYNIRLPSFQILIEKFIKEITAANYPMRLDWHRLERSRIEYILAEIKNYLGINNKIPKTRILVSKDKFLNSVLKFHDQLFLQYAEGRPVLINQGGSGWNPVVSTKYFFNRKVVMITRDPRDQFVELKNSYKKAGSVEGFVEWYKEMRRRLERIKDPDLLHIRFEDFVEENFMLVEKLCKHLSLDSNIKSKYEPNLSKKNIGKYREFLSQKEIKIIERSLSEYIY